MSSKLHWEQIYSTCDPYNVGWYQPLATRSLELIAATGISTDGRILDAGGGASLLVDSLLEAGHTGLTILDISRAAIGHCRERLGDRSDRVTWIESDIAEFASEKPLDLWHDRAVFHFLLTPEQREGYKRALNRSLAPSGHLIMATFALDGPPKCSGLDVARYSPETLCEELGNGFQLVESSRESHHTPAGKEQRYIFCRFTKR